MPQVISFGVPLTRFFRRIPLRGLSHFHTIKANSALEHNAKGDGEMQPNDVVCRRCGIVLARAQGEYSDELVVGSPGGSHYLVELVPRGRIMLRCMRCGAVREWHPPPRHRRKFPAPG